MTGSDELRLMGERLLILSGRPGDDNLEPAIHPDALVRLAAALISIRRIRAKHVGEDLFRDPAWDMLLDLFVRQARNHRTSVTSLCTASCSPDATALRWIDLLVDRGLIVREKCTEDARRVWVSLTGEGMTKMRRFLIDALNNLPTSNQGFMLGAGSR